MSKKRIPTMFVSGNIEQGNVYLTSGIQPPADDGSPMDQVELHSEMQSYASGGSIYHMNLTEKMPSKKKCKFIKSMFNNFPLRYVTLTPMLSICQDCGSKTIGKKVECPICGSKDISVWSRVVGYFRPAVRKNLSEDLKTYDHRFWMNGRFEEFLNRKLIDSVQIDDMIKSTQELGS